MGSNGGDPFTGTARFQVLRRIGAGGMGVVYEALDRERGGRVALKTLQRLDADSLYRLKREFRSLADVTHPNLVTLHELFADGGQWFFTMELVHGVHFLHFVRAGADGFEPASSTEVYPEPEDVPDTVDYRAGTRATPEAAAPARRDEPTATVPEDCGRLREALGQLAEGVAALHEAGKLHRDIKPSNVLVTPEGRVVLLDFGLVTELEEQPLGPGREHGVAGTFSYMSPEQAAGLPLAAASDWYSVGVMLYQALTGRRPFTGTRLQVLQAKQTREPRPPAEVAPDTPDDLNRLCVDLLRRGSGDRPPDREVLRRLGRRPPGPPALRAADPDRRSRMPFVGRERHVAALRDAYQASRQGKAVAVYVHGRSGVGKSLLVQRFLEQLAESESVVILAGRCYEQESVPYKALDSLVDALSRYLRGLPWQRAVELIPRNGPALARLFPVLRRVEALAGAPAQGPLIPDELELRRRGSAALRELLARLADRQPLVLAIDDLQWGDFDSAVLLTDLLRPPDPPPLLLIGSYRSEYAETSPCLRALLRKREGADARLDQRELALDQLTSEESRLLAAQLLGPDDPEAGARAEAIAREAGGSPYFVQELVRHVHSGPGLGGPPLSDRVTLDGVLWGRVEQLPEAARRLLEMVAVAGTPLHQADAFRAAGLGAEDFGALAVLRVGHLIRNSGAGEQDEVEAYHDRIRETVLTHLPSNALRAHHQRLAVTLQASGHADPESLAVHFQGAGEAERAGEYYAAAAAQAAAALAFDRAAKLYRLALELRPVGAAGGRELRGRLADALANAGRGPEAAREYLAAAAGAGAAEALEFQRRAAMQYLISGHIDDGLATLRTVLGAAGMRLAPTPRRALFSLLLRRARLRLRGLGFRERDPSQVSAEELTRIDICWSVAVGLSIVDTIRGADFQTRNLLLALRAGEPYRVARALAWEAAHVANTGGPARRRTARLLEATEALARRINHPHALGLATLAAGIAAYMEGRWRNARDLSEQAEAIFRDRCTGVAWERDTAHSFFLWSLTFLGEVAELTRRLPVLVKEARERGDLYAATNLVNFVGHLTWLAADDPEGARHDLREAMRQWSHEGFHVQHLTGLMGQVQIELYAGGGTSAWDLITGQWPALRASLFLRVQTVRIFMLHLRARSALLASAGARPPAPFLRAAERDARRLERERMPWSVPLAQLTRAGVAAARGQRASAAGLLDVAAAGFDAVDMALFAAAARRRRGELIGDNGSELIARADAWMAGQGIRNPARMAAMYVPGF